MEPIKISDQIALGGQPSEEDLGQLAQQGYKSVINLRLPGEDQQPLAPASEGDVARKLGMDYVHIPVAGNAMKDEQVDQFRKEMARLPKPVLVHCKSGKRADAFVTMHLGVVEGLSGEQALEKARRLGFEYPMAEMQSFIRRYVDRHQKEAEK